ncbi:MAG: hypothetical protein FJZ15_02345, partial [Candidatus Omnitrophica bacterium]|nr:hypothetical protein [Candidatus Omnitrophota bacterium]
EDDTEANLKKLNTRFEPLKENAENYEEAVRFLKNLASVFGGDVSINDLPITTLQDKARLKFILRDFKVFIYNKNGEKEELSFLHKNMPSSSRVLLEAIRLLSEKATFLKGFIARVDAKDDRKYPKPTINKKSLPSGAIRLQGGWLTPDEAKARKDRVGAGIRSGNVWALWKAVDANGEDGDVAISMLGDKRKLFSDLRKEYQEIFNTKYTFKNSGLDLRENFDLIFVNNLFDDVVFYPSWSSQRTYATWKYFHRLADLYEQLNDANRARVIQFLIEALRHELIHIDQESPRGPPITETLADSFAPSFRARELFRVIYTAIVTNTEPNLDNFLNTVTKDKDGNIEFISYLNAYAVTGSAPSQDELRKHIQIADKLLSLPGKINKILAQLHLGYVFNNTNPDSRVFGEAYNTLVYKEAIDYDPDTRQPFAAYSFIRELIRQQQVIRSGGRNGCSNIRLTSLEQLEPWRRGLQFKTQEEAEAYLKENPNLEFDSVVLPLPGYYTILKDENGNKQIFSYEQLERIGLENYMRNAAAIISAGGRGMRYANILFDEQGRQYVDPKAKGSYRIGVDGELHSIIEISLAQVAAKNELYRGRTYLDRNMPAIIMTSHLTENDIRSDLARIGYEKDPFNDHIYRYNNDPYYSDVLLIGSSKSHLIYKNTGDFLVNYEPNLSIEDAFWSDGHDASFVQPITSGRILDLVRDDYKYFFVSNVDNRAASLDPALLAMMAITGKPLINEIAIKPKGQKGGAPVRFKNDCLPPNINFGNNKGLIEGFQMVKAFDTIVKPEERAKGKAGITQEESDTYMPLFNTANYVVDIVRYIQQITCLSTQEAVKIWLSRFLTDNSTRSELKFHAMEQQVRLKMQCFEDDKRFPAKQCTNLAGDHTWVADTCFVEVIAGSDVAEDDTEANLKKLNTRFEPLKENAENYEEAVRFLKNLASVFGGDAEIGNLWLNDLKEKAQINYIVKILGVKDPTKTIAEALVILRNKAGFLSSFIQRVESKKDRRFPEFTANHNTDGPAIRLQGGSIQQGEHKVLSKYIRQAIISKQQNAWALFNSIQFGPDEEGYIPVPHYSPESSPETREFYEALTASACSLISNNFEIVLLNGITHNLGVVLTRSWSHNHAYAMKEFLDQLAVLYPSLDVNKKKLLIKIICEAIVHENKHRTAEGILLSEEETDKIAPSFRARELFKVVYSWIIIGQNREERLECLNKFIGALESNYNFVNYIDAYNGTSDAVKHLEIAKKIIANHRHHNDAGSWIVLVQYHLGRVFALTYKDFVNDYVVSQVALFKEAFDILISEVRVEGGFIDPDPFTSSRIPAFRFITELIRRDIYIHNRNNPSNINILLKDLNQLNKWEEDVEFEQDILILKVAYNQAEQLIQQLTIFQEVKNKILFGINPHHDDSISITRESLEFLGEQFLNQLFVEVLAGGLGARFAEVYIDGQGNFYQSEEPKANYRIDVDGGRTILEILFAQVAGANKAFREKGILTQHNIPVVLYTSHHTHAGLVGEIKRLGYRELIPRSGHFTHANTNIYYPEVYVIQIPVAYILYPNTGDFLRRMYPQQENDDLFWPDGHDSSFFDSIRSGMLAKLAKNNYRYSLISNIDNRAANIDPRFLGLMYLTGSTLINEVCTKPEGQKGGSAASVKEPLFNYVSSRAPGTQGLLEEFQMSDYFRKEITTEETKIFLPNFNSANYWKDNFRFLEQTCGIKPDQIPSFLEKFLSPDRDYKAELFFKYFEAPYRLASQAFEPSRVRPVITPSNLAGMVTWMVDTLFVKVKTGIEGISRFEPQKAYEINFRHMLGYLNELQRQYNLPDDALLENIKSDATINPKLKTAVSWVIKEIGGKTISEAKTKIEKNINGIKKSYKVIEGLKPDRIYVASAIPVNSILPLVNAHSDKITLSEEKSDSALIKEMIASGKKLILLSGPSAVGKGPLWEQIQRHFPGYFSRVVLYTSRDARKGEEEGVTYFFRKSEEIQKLVDNNPEIFLMQGVHGKEQGLDLRDVAKAFESGKVPLIEVSVDWAKMLREKFGKQIFSIFMSPLSDEEIERRCREQNKIPEQVVYEEMFARQKERGADTEKDWEKRARNAVGEMERKGEYDAVIINDKLHDCASYDERWNSKEGQDLTEEFMALVIKAAGIMPSKIDFFIADEAYNANQLSNLSVENKVIAGTRYLCGGKVLSVEKSKHFMAMKFIDNDSTKFEKIYLKNSGEDFSLFIITVRYDPYKNALEEEYPGEVDRVLIDRRGALEADVDWTEFAYLVVIKHVKKSSSVSILPGGESAPIPVGCLVNTSLSVEMEQALKIAGQELTEAEINAALEGARAGKISGQYDPDIASRFQQIDDTLTPEEIKVAIEGAKQEKELRSQLIIVRKNELVSTPSDLPIQLKVQELKTGEKVDFENILSQYVVYVESGTIKACLRDSELPYQYVTLNAGDLITVFTTGTFVAETEAKVSLIIQTPALAGKSDYQLDVLVENGVPEVIYDWKYTKDILAMILRGNLDFPKYRVITNPQFALGVGTKSPVKGEIGRPHVHTPVEKPKLELLIMAKGRARYTVYTPQGKNLGAVLLQEGDRVISLGGHNIEFLGEENKIIEVCEGPYPGPEKAKVFFDQSAPSARTRPGKATPTQEEVDKAFAGIDISNFKPVDNVYIEQTIKTLRFMGEAGAARLLKELASAQHVRAPPKEILITNTKLRRIFKKVFGLVLLNGRGLPYILIAPDVTDEANPESMPTSIHEAVEAYLRYEKKVSRAEAHRYAVKIEESYVSARDFSECWKYLAEQNLLAPILGLHTAKSNENRIKTIRSILRKVSNSSRIADFDKAYFEDNHVDIFYSLEGKPLLVRIAPDHFIDYLTDTDKTCSYLGQGLRVDIIFDQEEIKGIKDDLEFYKLNPEFYKLVYKLNSDNPVVILEAIERLNALLDTPALKNQAERLLNAALGIDNWQIQAKAQKILTKTYSGRPSIFPQASQTKIAKIDEDIKFDNLILRVGFNPFIEKNKFKQFSVRLAVAKNTSNKIVYKALKAVPDTDSSVRLILQDVLKAEKGIIHVAIQTRQGERGKWQYSQEENSNVIIFCQKDLRGAMIYQAWSAYLGIYGQDNRVRYDAKGRAIPGTFKNIEDMLPRLEKDGYRYVYVMGAYQLDKPENIPGQVGPDASLFSPLSFNISKELGGEEGLKKLVIKAKKMGIGVIVDLIPHVNQNFRDLPEWAYVKAKAYGKIVRRLATDGSVNHEDGSPVEWHDSTMLNWRDNRVLKAFGELVNKLAGLGISGARVDVAHRLGMMLPVDGSLNSKQKLFANITSWERNTEGGFKVVNQWQTNEANPFLVYLVSQINKNYRDFIFIGENYGRDIQLIKSGVIPMDAGTYMDLQKVIIKGEGTDVLNGHFRWLLGQLPEGAQVVSALETHDFYRLMDRWQSYGPCRLKAAIWTWLATTRGPIMIYNRQEIGEVHRIRIDNFTYHNYEEADRQRYYAQLDFKNIYGETVQEFYKRALALYRDNEILHTGENYIFNDHNKIFVIARYGNKENLTFVVNCSWEEAYIEIKPSSLWAQFGVKNSAKNYYIITERESGKQQVFTGEELVAENLSVQLSSYGIAVFSIKEAKGYVSVKGNLLNDSLLRYNSQYKPRRITYNYAFKYIEEAVLSPESGLFHTRFAELAHKVEGASKVDVLQAADLTVIAHDILLKHKNCNIKRLLSAVVQQSTDKLVKDVATKVLAWVDVGVVVFVSPEAAHAKSGGMGSVVGELPVVLTNSGLKVYVISCLYKYSEDPEHNFQRKEIKDEIIRRFGIRYTGKLAQVYMGRHGMYPAAIASAKIKGVDYFLLDNPIFADALYGQLRGDTVDTNQKATKEHEELRAIFLSLGSLEAMKMMNIHPDIVVGNDWTCAPLMAHLNSARSLYKN